MTQFGSVANLLANTDQISNAKLRTKVEENAQLAAMSRRLATINQYVPLDIEINQYKVMQPDYNALINLYVKLEFNSFFERLHIEDNPEMSMDFEDSDVEYRKTEISDPKGLQFLKELNQSTPVIIKVFSDNSHIDAPSIFGMAFLINDNYYYVNLDMADIRVSSLTCSTKKRLKIIGHDLIKDYYALMYKGFYRSGYRV